MAPGALWLIGMPGAGKSTVGVLVAEILDVPFLDTDALIESAAGEPARDLVGRDEPAFRAMERHAVDTAAESGGVVATGGGAVLDDGSVLTMRRSGLVVWLTVPVEVLEQRVGTGDERPLLGDDPAAALQGYLEARGELYEAAAHVSVDGDQPPEAVAKAVADVWETIT